MAEKDITPENKNRNSVIQLLMEYPEGLRLKELEKYLCPAIMSKSTLIRCVEFLLHRHFLTKDSDDRFRYSSSGSFWAATYAMSRPVEEEQRVWFSRVLKYQKAGVDMTSTVSGRGPLDVIEEKRFYEDFEKEVSPVIANFLKTHQLNSNVTIITRAEKKEK